MLMQLLCSGVWSPAGGWWADPKHWRRNTALAFGCVFEAKARVTAACNTAIVIIHKVYNVIGILACRAIILLGIPVFRMSARLEVRLAHYLHADAIVSQLS